MHIWNPLIGLAHKIQFMSFIWIMIFDYTNYLHLLGVALTSEFFSISGNGVCCIWGVAMWRTLFFIRFKFCDKENLICPSKISVKVKKLWVWDICMEWIDLQYIWRPIIRRALFGLNRVPSNGIQVEFGQNWSRFKYFQVQPVTCWYLLDSLH